MQASQLTAINNAKLLLEQCGCFRGPPGPEGPQGPTGPAGKTLYYYADSINNDPNVAGVDPCVYGLFIGADGYLWRSSPATAIDSSFTASLLNGTVRTIAKQSDGKILVGGDFTFYDTTSYNYIIRFNNDGTVDTSFNVGTGFDALVRTIAIQSDNKILVGGDFELYKGSTYRRIIRLNSDGTVDSTFNSVPGFVGASVYSIVVNTDGKLYVGGDFTFYNSDDANNIARLTSAGFYDPLFPTGGVNGFNGPVYSISLQTDGSLMIGGAFTAFSGTTTSGIAHVLSDGTIDNTNFIIGSGFNNSVYFIKLLDTSNLLVCGAFTQYNGTTANYIIEIYANGSIYSTFSSGFDSSVRTVQVDSSNNLLFGGDFTSYNGNSNHYLSRTELNGTYLSDYPIIYGFNNPVFSIYPEASNKFLVGGSFTSYDSSTTRYLTRLTEKPCSWINTYTNILGSSSNTSTFVYALVSTTNGLGTLGYVSTSQLTSTVRGLGTVGYISTPSLQSTIIGLGNLGYLSTAGSVTLNNLTSTVVGLGTAGYISSSQLTSTVNGLGTATSVTSTINGLGNLGYISSSQLTSTIVGLGSLRYVSSSQLASTVANLGFAGYISSSQLSSTVRGIPMYIQPNITSSLIGLGNLGYISSSQLLSTTQGLIDSPELQSSIVGLGTLGYISSSQLVSTVNSIGINLTSSLIGLGNLGYISSSQLLSTTQGLIDSPELQSSIVGLGTLGYISSSQLVSTVNGIGTNTQPNLTSSLVGLGTLGYISSSQLISTVNSIDINLTSSLVGLGNLGYISSSQLLSTTQGLIDSPELQSSIVGLGTLGYISSSQLVSTVNGIGTNTQPNLTSSLVGLGTLGYISSSQLLSTVNGIDINLTSSLVGLGTLGYISSSQLVSTVNGIGTNTQPNLTSSLVGLGTLGYISSSQLVSTVNGIDINLTSSLVGLGTLGYISSSQLLSTTQGLIDTPELQSSIVGLGNLGYISSSQLVSTTIGLVDHLELNSSIIGLGTLGYISSFNSISSLNISTGNLFANTINSSTISNVDGLFTNTISTAQINTRNLIVSSIFTSTISTTIILADRLIGTSNTGVYTGNLYPFSVGSQVGFGSGLSGFYSAVFTQSTVTNNLTADFGNPNSNITVTGNIIPSFSSFSNSSLGNFSNRWNNILNNNLVTSTISSYTSSITISANFIPTADNRYTLGTSSLRWRSLFVGPSSIYVGDIAEINANNDGYLTTNIGFEIPQINVNSISSGGTAVFTNISSLVYGGIESYNYISTTGLESSLRGLGTLNYISSTQLFSTTTGLVDHAELNSSITGLGNIGYISSTQLTSSVSGIITAPRTMIIQTFTF